MSIVTSWIIPGQLLEIRLEDDVSPDELQALHHQLRDVLGYVQGRLNFLLDVTTLQAPADETVLKLMLDRNAFLRSTKTGRVLVVGANEAQKDMLEGVVLALHLELYYFDSMDEALAFDVEGR